MRLNPLRTIVDEPTRARHTNTKTTKNERFCQVGGRCVHEQRTNRAETLSSTHLVRNSGRSFLSVVSFVTSEVAKLEVGSWVQIPRVSTLWKDFIYIGKVDIKIPASED